MAKETKLMTPQVMNETYPIVFAGKLRKMPLIIIRQLAISVEK
jgi:hypothetical protein